MPWSASWPSRTVLGALLVLSGCFEDPVMLNEDDGGTATSGPGTTSSLASTDATSSSGSSTGSGTSVADGGSTVVPVETGDGSTTEHLEQESTEAEVASSHTGGEAEATGGSTSTGSASETEGNVLPVAASDVYLVAQGDTLVVAVGEGLLANDEDPNGESLAAVLQGDVAGLTLASDGSFTYAPAATYWGETSFAYAAVDGSGAQSVATVRIVVAPRAVSLVQVAADAGGFAIDGDSTSSRSGSAVAGAGDFDGDGFDDVVVGAPAANEGSEEFAGRTFIVYGHPEVARVRLGEANTPREVSSVRGEVENNRLGQSVGTAGDLNADGRHEIVMGVPGAAVSGQPTIGRAFLLGGRMGLGSLGVSSIGSDGFGFGVLGESSRTAENVGPAGDVNGDGIPDLIVGARFAPAATGGANAGMVYVVFGSTASVNLDLAQVRLGVGGFAISGEAAGDEAGFSVRGAGDVNGDGLADVILGARYAGQTPSTDVGTGRSYVVFGKRDTAAVALAAVAQEQGGGFMIAGQAADDRMGFRVSGAGDVNGDGLGDVIVGARRADVGASANNGKAYVVFGKISAEAVLATDVEAGAGGFVLRGERGNDEAGSIVAGGVLRGADVNADGLDDVLVGAWQNNANEGSDNGRAYLVYGREETSPVELRLIAGGDGGFAIDGELSGDRMGGAGDIVGDVNGDGFLDIAVGASYAAPGGLAESGRSYVVFGGDFTRSVDALGTGDADVLEGSIADERFVAGAGDDTIFAGGGADVVYAGRGSDRIETPDLDFMRVDGGPGLDTLRITTANLASDISELPLLALQSVEILEISGTGSVLRLRAVDLSRAERRTLRVDGEGQLFFEVGGLAFDDTAAPGGYRRYRAGTLTLEVAETMVVTLVQ